MKRKKPFYVRFRYEDFTELLSYLKPLRGVSKALLPKLSTTFDEHWHTGDETQPVS